RPKSARFKLKNTTRWRRARPNQQQQRARKHLQPYRLLRLPLQPLSTPTARTAIDHGMTFASVVSCKRISARETSRTARCFQRTSHSKGPSQIATARTIETRRTIANMADHLKDEGLSLRLVLLPKSKIRSIQSGRSTPAALATSHTKPSGLRLRKREKEPSWLAGKMKSPLKRLALSPCKLPTPRATPRR
ncbi:TPA: hypothetical protein N0F65_009494, partial [Lagenidium giganteum]